MTKKDYVAIAGAFREVRAYRHFDKMPGENALIMLARRIAAACEKDNGRFDRDRFLRACRIPADDDSALREGTSGCDDCVELAGYCTCDD